MHRASRAYVYKRTEQGDLLLYVYLPTRWQADGDFPCVAFFFGGGWVSGTVEHFARQATYLASRGMVAVCADYRVRSRHNVFPDKCVEDAKSTIRWMRANRAELHIDPDRLVASGGSAGAHIAACAGIIEGFEAPEENLGISSVPNAMVLFNPPLEAADDSRIRERFGSLKLAVALSPNRHIRPGLPDTLVLHGIEDAVVPFSQSETFVRLMNETGNRAELYVGPGQPHGFFNRSPWYERTLHRMDEFFASIGYLEGEPTVQLP